jgi:hypothetical protein
MNNLSIHLTYFVSIFPIKIDATIKQEDVYLYIY